MSATIASLTVCPCATLASRRPVQASASSRQSLALRKSQVQGTRIVATPRMRPFQARKSTVQTAAAMELFQLADELSYISGVAAVTFAVTLVGLAAGFVLLRVEALTEEGKL